MSVIHVEKIQMKASCVQVDSVNLKMYMQKWNDKIVNLLIKEFIGINKLLRVISTAHVQSAAVSDIAKAEYS